MCYEFIQVHNLKAISVHINKSSSWCILSERPDDTRVRTAVPINYLTGHGAKVIISSHLDSFEVRRTQSRGGDIELGSLQMNSAELGLDNFFKKEIDSLIEAGDSEQIFQKAIQEQGRGQILFIFSSSNIMDTVAEIQERHDAVRNLEKKLVDMQQIFLDMAVLVDQQGEMLDNIETQEGKVSHSKNLQMKISLWKKNVILPLNCGRRLYTLYHLVRNGGIKSQCRVIALG